MQRKIGIIFDMDGTILNTLDDLADSINYTLSYYHYPKKSLEEVRNAVGRGIRVLVEKALPDKVSKEKTEEVLEFFKKYYSEHLQVKTKPYDGIIQLLKIMKENKVRMAVVSNKFQKGVEDLNEQFFQEYIEVAIGNREGMKTKPDPDSVFLAAKELGLIIGQDEIYYVGDSEVDIQTAHNAQIPIISCTWGFRKEEELLPYEPDFIVSDPTEIMNIIPLR